MTKYMCKIKKKKYLEAPMGEYYELFDREIVRAGTGCDK